MILTNSMQGIYPTLMFVMLRDSVWNSQEDPQSSRPSGRGAEVFTTIVASQMHSAPSVRSEVERNVPLGSGTMGETGLPEQGDPLNTFVVSEAQEKEQALTLSGLAL